MNLRILNNENMSTDLNCIWAISKLIGVKYCEKQFECEACPLDMIMRNITRSCPGEEYENLELGDTAYIDRIIEGIDSADYQNNLIYLKNHWMLKNLYANIYYLGLNSLITPLLDNITSIKEYMKKIYFTKGQKLMMLEGDWGKLPLSVPMNFLLLDKLNWSPEEINVNKWIALIVANQNEVQEAEISADGWNLEKSRLINLMSEFKEYCSLISSHDGIKAKKLNKFYQLIGGGEYTKMLDGIFNS